MMQGGYLARLARNVQVVIALPLMLAAKVFRAGVLFAELRLGSVCLAVERTFKESEQWAR